MLFRKRANAVLPFPLKPSGTFEGNDGNWSTFNLGVGTPPQNFHVLVSMLGDASWLPGEDGCEGADRPHCPSLRGVEGSSRNSSLTGFDGDQSTSFQQTGSFDLGFNSDFTMDAAFGTDYGISVDYARDTFSLPSTSGGTLNQDATPFTFLSSSQFFLGALGLGYADIDYGSGKEPSLLQTLVNNASIPSKSWGYTAGAFYRNRYAGSLVLGGYDQDRFEPTDMEFLFPSSTNQAELEVLVQEIQIDFGGSTITPTQNVFTAIIDSTLPYLYLPRDVCDAFAQQLNLTFNSELNLYTISDSQRRNLTNSIQDISFTLVDSHPDRAGNSTTISFPYSAFDLYASWPIVDDPTSYFPIRRANKTSILGRAFLQEAYVIANYEHGNFTVAQAAFPDSPQPTIVAIPSINEPKPSSKGLGGGAIAGIVVGVLAAVAVAAAVWFFLAKKRRARNRAAFARQKEEDEELEERRRQGTIASTIGSGTLHAEEGTDVSYEMDAHSSIIAAKRPTHSRHVSELSSDSEISGMPRHKPRNSVIYELEGGAPDVEAWQLNEDRMNEHQLDDTSRSLAPPSDADGDRASEQTTGHLIEVETPASEMPSPPIPSPPVPSPPAPSLPAHSPPASSPPWPA